MIGPLLWPAIASGWLFIFLIATKEISLPLLLAGPGSQTIAVAMFDLWANGQGGEVAALGLLWAIHVVVCHRPLWVPTPAIDGHVRPLKEAAAMLEVAGLTKVYANTGEGVAGGVRDAAFALELECTPEVDRWGT